MCRSVLRETMVIVWRRFESLVQMVWYWDMLNNSILHLERARSIIGWFSSQDR